MSFFKWLKRHDKKAKQKNTPEDLNDHDEDDDSEPKEEEQQQEAMYYYRSKLVYLTSTTQNQNVIDILSVWQKDVPTFTDENECLEYIKSIRDKIFLIIDGQPSTNLLEVIKSLKQIDSVFFYSPSSDTITTIHEKKLSYTHYLCENDSILRDTIRKSQEELDKQIATIAMFHREEIAIYYLSKEQGSYLFFQLFKFTLKHIPKTNEAKQTMIKICRQYYRGNLPELQNIDEFDRTYKSCEAIPWFTKKSFLNEIINKVLRTQDFEFLHSFRYYILDLSEQLEIKFQELKKNQKDSLKLYHAVQLNHDEMIKYQKNTGNLISNNEYLTLSSKYSVAYDYVTKFTKQDGIVHALIEYIVDLNVVQNIVLADVQLYSAYSEQAQFIVDIGAVFQINSCEYNHEEDLWHIKLNATDKGADLATEYMKYQKAEIAKLSPRLFFGHLLLEVGEYSRAESYFVKLLDSANDLNNEEIPGIFFYLGRSHRFRGDSNRAVDCYNRAYNIYMNARPKHKTGAGRALNDLGLVYSERDQALKAEECFKRALELFEKRFKKDHVDIAETLINLSTFDCIRQDFDQALNKCQQAKKIFDEYLPSLHPSQALLRVSFGNVYLAAGNYQKALEEYEAALKLQEALLPNIHLSTARTLHSLAIVHNYQGNIDEARKCLERVEDMAGQFISVKHPFMVLINQTKEFLADQK